MSPTGQQVEKAAHQVQRGAGKHSSLSMPASEALGQKTNLMPSEVSALASAYKTNYPWVKCQPLSFTLMQTGLALAAYMDVLVPLPHPNSSFGFKWLPLCL